MHGIWNKAWHTVIVVIVAEVLLCFSNQIQTLSHGFQSPKLSLHLP